MLAFQKALWPGGRTPKGSAFVYHGNLYGRLGILLVGAAFSWSGWRSGSSPAPRATSRRSSDVTTPIIRVSDVSKKFNMHKDK